MCVYMCVCIYMCVYIYTHTIYYHVYGCCSLFITLGASQYPSTQLQIFNCCINEKWILMELNKHSGDGIRIVYNMQQLDTTHHLSCLIVMIVQSHGLN